MEEKKVKVTKTKIKYTKLEANPRIRALLPIQEPETELRVAFEMKGDEADPASLEGIEVDTRLEMNDSVMFTSTMTVADLDVLEASDAVVTYTVSPLAMLATLF